MMSRILTTTTGPRFTQTERRALAALRDRYQTAHHIFTERELAHLRFVSWLVQGPSWNHAMDDGPSDDRARRPSAGEATTWRLNGATS